MLDPYATVPAAPQPGQPAGARIAICYNAVTTARAAAHEAAQRECPAGTLAQAVETDLYLDHCPLLLPARASFACTPGK